MGLEGLLGATRSTTGMVTERRTVTALNGRRRQAVVVDGKQFVVPRVVDNAVREGDTIRLEFGRFSGELLSLSVRDEA
jgi:hypothetical protein